MNRPNNLKYCVMLAILLLPMSCFLRQETVQTNPSTNHDAHLTGSQGSLVDPVSQEPFRDLTNIEKPILLKRVPPNYPKELRNANIEGTAVFELLISREGKVESVKMTRSAGNPQLDEAALEAVVQWLYKPAKWKGRPVSVYFQASVDFKLK